MNKDSFWAIIKADIRRYIGPPEDSFLLKLRRLTTAEGLWVTILFRLIQISLNKHIPLIPLILKLLYWFITIFFGIRISLKAMIGKGLFIHLHGGIFIGEAIIGDHCMISNSVTIGYGSFNTPYYGSPTIGSNVFIGPGAKVFGKITVGKNVSIGANAVVSKDVPDNAVVMGNPGRIVGYNTDSLNRSPFECYFKY